MAAPQRQGEVLVVGEENVLPQRRSVSSWRRWDMRGTELLLSVTAECMLCYTYPRRQRTPIGFSLGARSSRLRHYKFFLWMDQYAAKFVGAGELLDSLSP
ncbi:hypothetical protein PIB30_100226 [Stylosanthes scabra]|uniref:Uncharacterized protein n=1 Tax=Stylosanthes scabra TaxID=79078 RepID=A0ABU6WX17_9FABA|nr:hypothetical protein [Stylosanthes scabra]